MIGKKILFLRMEKGQNQNEYIAEGIILQTMRTLNLTSCREEVLQWMSCQSKNSQDFKGLGRPSTRNYIYSN